MVAIPVAEAEETTLDDLLQHAGRAEVYDGELVEMSASGIAHNVIISNVWRILDAYAQRTNSGLAFGDGATFLMYSTLPRLKDSFEPDVSFLSKENIPAHWDVVKPHPGAPDFAVEVISPDDRADRVQYKARTYLEKGTKQVWLVYPELHEVYVYTVADVRRYVKGQSIELGDLLPGIAPVPLAAIFDLPEWLIKQTRPITE